MNLVKLPLKRQRLSKNNLIIIVQKVARFSLHLLLLQLLKSLTTVSDDFIVKSPAEKTRYDTSLGLLTKRFVGLLQSAPSGVSTFLVYSTSC